MPTAHKTILTTGLAAGLLAAGALPSFGAGSGTLTGEVTMPAPCIEITLDDQPEVATGLYRDSPQFSTSSSKSRVFLQATDGTTLRANVDVHNCADQPQDFSVVGTPAENAAAPQRGH